MLSDSLEPAPRVLLIGVGDLTMRLSHLLAASAGPVDLVIGSRSIERATRFANLIKFTATNLGRFRTVDAVELDLSDTARTAADLERLAPSVIFMGASIQAARAIMDLPLPIFRRLDEAQLGPWLPMHLTLVYELMQAVRLAGIPAVVVNGAYPDAVGPALATLDLAPDIGIGNVGNIVPGLTWAAAEQLGVAPSDVTTYVIGHHYFSHHVHRFGEAEGVPYEMRFFVGSQQVQVDAPKLFSLLTTTLRRQGGRDGQQLTATSAVRVVTALFSEEVRAMHAPAPGGMVGGYPVRVSRRGVSPALPPGMDVRTAESINQRCQTLDGIEAIEPGGIVRFSEPNMSIMKDLLGYHRTELAVADSRGVAMELAARYREFLVRNGPGAAPSGPAT